MITLGFPGVGIAGAALATPAGTSWLGSTCRKNGVHVLTALRDALVGERWAPGYATA